MPFSTSPFPGTFTWGILLSWDTNCFPGGGVFSSVLLMDWKRENWNRTSEKMEGGSGRQGLATGGIMATEGGELDFMECCCAIGRNMGCSRYSYRNKLWSGKLSSGQGEWEDWKWLSSRGKLWKCSQTWQWLGLFVKELRALIPEHRNMFYILSQRRQTSSRAF